MTESRQSDIPDHAMVICRGARAVVLGREWCESCEREHIAIAFLGSRTPFLADPEDLRLASEAD